MSSLRLLQDSIISGLFHCKAQNPVPMLAAVSWDLTKRLQKRRDRETGAIVRDPGGRTSIALVYPNTYAVGMGNLAVHALYRLFHDRADLACERAFLPSREELSEYRRTGAALMTIETQRPLSDFDVIAFTISFENDYLNLLPILDLAKIPHRAEERRSDSSLLVAGGAAPILNPAPISQIFDAIALGEAEALAPDLLPLLAQRLPKGDLLAALEKIDGVWVPTSGRPADAVGRRWTEDLDSWPVQTIIHSDDTEFGDMHLIEVQRGCPFACRFCATPAIYGMPRHRSAAAVIRMVDEGLAHRKKFGLIGTHLLSHPGFAAIADAIHERGASFSLSSVRAEEIDDNKAALLARAGHRSVALGIEAGSDGLRDSLGKRLSDDRIFASVAALARAGIGRIRLYFMIGLPGETDEDIDAIAELAARVRDIVRTEAPKKTRQTSVDCTLSPFVPKPGTPFAHEPFAGEKALKGKVRRLKKLFAKEGGITMGADPIAEAVTEAFLAGADSSAIEFLEGRL